jgi:GT2 family glycosyltransferase
MSLMPSKPLAKTCSALVSAYYSELFLEGRLANLLEQDGPPEVIVVCQKGSKEAQIARDFDVRVIVTPDIPTIGVAWNIAIRAATGDYCVIANTDDHFVPGGLKLLSDVLDNNPDVGYVFSDVYIADRGLTTLWHNRGRLASEGMVPEAAALLKQRYFCGPMPMWRRELHTIHGYYNEDYIVAGDYDWVLRLAEAGVGIYWLDKSVGVYQVRQNSLEKRNGKACRNESMRIRGVFTL